MAQFDEKKVVVIKYITYSIQFILFDKFHFERKNIFLNFVVDFCTQSSRFLKFQWNKNL